MELDKHIIDKINEGHQEIINDSVDIINKAIVVGKEIIRAREISGHGEFGKLIDGGIFKMKSAQVYRYIKVAEYSAKLSSSRNLQEAYKLIESEESKKTTLPATSSTLMIRISFFNTTSSMSSESPKLSFGGV